MALMVSWIVRSDPPILELLDECDLALPPAVIHYNIDRVSHPTVKRRIAVMLEHDFVRKVDERGGYYRITDRGRAYLAGELDVEDLEADEE